jgi:FixJ family two-component response regulator
VAKARPAATKPVASSKTAMERAGAKASAMGRQTSAAVKKAVARLQTSSPRARKIAAAVAAGVVAAAAGLAARKRKKK